MQVSFAQPGIALRALNIAKAPMFHLSSLIASHLYFVTTCGHRQSREGVLNQADASVASQIAYCSTLTCHLSLPTHFTHCPRAFLPQLLTAQTFRLLFNVLTTTTVIALLTVMAPTRSAKGTTKPSNSESSTRASEHIHSNPSEPKPHKPAAAMDGKKQPCEPSDDSSVDCDCEDCKPPEKRDIAELGMKFHAIYHDLIKSDFWKDWKTTMIEKFRGTKINRFVCIALGSMAKKRGERYVGKKHTFEDDVLTELAFLLAMVSLGKRYAMPLTGGAADLPDAVEKPTMDKSNHSFTYKTVRIIFQDPDFAPEDITFLRRVGGIVVDDPQAFRMTTPKTLLYAANPPMVLLWAKVFFDLRPAFLITNSVHSIAFGLWKDL